MAFIQASIGDIPVVGGVAGSILEGQPLSGRVDKLILIRVVCKVLGSELAFADQLGVAKVVGVLLEGVVLEVVPDPMLF